MRRLRTMRYFLLLITLLLTGCDDSQVSTFAHSPGVKQLAKIGQNVLSQPNRVRPSQEPTPAATSAELVNSKKQVGHRNFNSAKKVLPEVYAGMEDEFYCGCKYSGKDVDLPSCGYVPRKNANRAGRIEWEHVVPAAHLGSQRQCWQEGGRKNCSGKDPLFDMMEGDLNNLVPSVGEVNGDRGDMSYGAWTKNPEPVYGQCTSLPDFKNKRFQPREEVRGRAARISLYMHTRYGLNMSNQDKKLWCAWAKTYPVDGWEKVRNERIIHWQGEGNSLVTDPAIRERICG